MNNDPLQFPVREIEIRNLLLMTASSDVHDEVSQRAYAQIAKEIAAIEPSLGYKLNFTIPGAQTAETISKITDEVSRCLETYKSAVLKDVILPLIIRALKAEGRWV